MLSREPGGRVRRGRPKRKIMDVVRGDMQAAGATKGRCRGLGEEETDDPLQKGKLCVHIYI